MMEANFWLEWTSNYANACFLLVANELEGLCLLLIIVLIKVLKFSASQALILANTLLCHIWNLVPPVHDKFYHAHPYEEDGGHLVVYHAS